MLTRRHFTQLAALGSVGAFAAESRPAANQGQANPAHPKSRLRQIVSGALIKDNFDSGRMDTSVWEMVQTIDPGIKVAFENGELRIWGTSAEIPEEKFRDMTQMCRYAGLHSRNFANADVSLACRVKMPSGICSEPDDHVAAVHLCGVYPDCYSEVLFGKFEGKATAEIMKRYYPKYFPVYNDARGWFFAIVGQDAGRPVYRVSGKSLELDDETTTFHDALVDYDEPTHTARGYLKIGDRWTQLGETESIIRGLTKVELKLRNFSPLYGTYRDVRFDDCRLYPNPRRNPVRIVLVNCKLPAEGAPPLRVALYTADGSRKVSEDYVDHEMARLQVVDTSWVAFPVSASIRVYRADTELARADIEAHDVEGLYPGDLWTFSMSKIAV